MVMQPLFNDAHSGQHLSASKGLQDFVVLEVTEKETQAVFPEFKYPAKLKT